MNFKKEISPKLFPPIYSLYPSLILTILPPFFFLFLIYSRLFPPHLLSLKIPKSLCSSENPNPIRQPPHRDPLSVGRPPARRRPPIASSGSAPAGRLPPFSFISGDSSTKPRPPRRRRRRHEPPDLEPRAPPPFLHLLRPSTLALLRPCPTPPQEHRRPSLPAPHQPPSSSPCADAPHLQSPKSHALVFLHLHKPTPPASSTPFRRSIRLSPLLPRHRRSLLSPQCQRTPPPHLHPNRSHHPQLSPSSICDASTIFTQNQEVTVTSLPCRLRPNPWPPIAGRPPASHLQRPGCSSGVAHTCDERTRRQEMVLPPRSHRPARACAGLEPSSRPIARAEQVIGI